MRKRNLKILGTVTYLVIAIIPFVYWYKKDNIRDEFRDIQSRVYVSNYADPIFNQCQSVQQFISDHPIDIQVELNCNELTDPTKAAPLRGDFINEVHKIETAYDREARVANRWMFGILLLLILFRGLVDGAIEKKDKERVE